ncbi:protein of unknown function [Pseudodesulfovibrio profundus]|uniref:Uncharacterized protein n=1 Tax=Pseudodesulfovibrio profundus TaxID=57320 RepID=A0A2C8F955_9BACT|nr:protein of unknown function [Pseudodesulfovibrio profundus]
MDDTFFETLEGRLPEYFTRQFFCELVPGLWSPKTLANVESADPNCNNGKRIIGGKAVYQKRPFMKWLKSRCRN